MPSKKAKEQAAKERKGRARKLLEISMAHCAACVFAYKCLYTFFIWYRLLLL